MDACSGEDDAFFQEVVVEGGVDGLDRVLAVDVEENGAAHGGVGEAFKHLRQTGVCTRWTPPTHLNGQGRVDTQQCIGCGEATRAGTDDGDVHGARGEGVRVWHEMLFYCRQR